MEQNIVDTLCFLNMIEDLTRLSKNGIKPFKEATLENFDNYLFYNSLIELDTDTMDYKSYHVVLTPVIDNICHHEY